MDALEHLFHARAQEADALGPALDLTTWRERLALCPFKALVDRALWAGFEADRLGYAFVGGYQAALARLLAGSAKVAPAMSALPVRSLAATEAGGGHPRAMETTLAEVDGALRLRGVKTFATLASIADEILVVASRGKDDGGKNRLVVARVRRDAAGLTLTDRTPTPFAPEIPHATVTLDDVSVTPADVLPGDGYDAYLKPFRTIEDTHVLAASIGHLVRIARAYAFAEALTERLLALALAVRALAERAPSELLVHLALAGMFGDLRTLLAEHDGEWAKASTEVRERWQRDRGLLLVAESVRQARTAAAWRALQARTK